TAFAAKPDRDALGVGRLGVAEYLVEIHELAAMRTVLLRPQLAHHIYILARALGAALKRNAQRLELFFRSSDPHAQDYAAPAQPVDGRYGLGQHDGIVFRNDTDSGGKFDIAGARRHVSQRCKRVRDLTVRRPGKFTARVGIARDVSVNQDHVFRSPDRREPEPLRVCDRGPEPLWIGRGSYSDAEVSDLHGA